GDKLVVKKKIVLLGDSAVGKTSLIRRYVFDQFEDTYIATIGSKVTKKELKIPQSRKSANLKLMIWDLIGREGYQGLHARTFVGVDGAILVADITRRETLLSLERYWVPFLIKVVGDVPMVFTCNKSDLKDDFEFDYDEIEEIASKYNKGFNEIIPEGLELCFTTSAKFGSNVESAFQSLGHLVLHNKEVMDPIKELYDSLVATGIRRNADNTTPVGALDAVIVDFCEGFDDSRMAMLILRQELARAGIDINNPRKKDILKAVEYLAEAENEFKDNKIVISNLKRRMEWAEGVKE
ncbi:MAG: GTP-binding protein, partial [Thermoplasmata archaeon]